MATEIERKYLVANDSWRNLATGSKRLRQGYLARTGAATVRVRITDDAAAVITVKATGTATSRAEYEYAIPVEDARALLDLAQGRPVEKRRHLVPGDPGTWEIDVFEGAQTGLVLAEMELEDEAAEIVRPDWLGREVTGDPRYYNATLAGLDPVGDT
ncbi:CYTH domain-containing protein [uncultured Jannaschia sp.]|uniref:CYTH domain-containing protein n=1 Tax=uncultured Jannaschia sp. TaxID=293347 RepID=UPI00260784AC|nr:CYTH domain-containing protein [uncultured Jannaschia sp.]